MARKAKNASEISEAKIRQCIWMLKTGKTKKACCEHLGIPYNTKKLDKIISDFNAAIEREKRLKKAAQSKIFTTKEKEQIAKEYLAGESQSALAKQYYISPQKIKKILLDTGTPIRGRGKNSKATVNHIVQDLETKFSINDKVFIAKYNCFGIIDQVYDEDYLEYLENGRQRYVETHSFKPNKQGLAGNYVDPTEGVHYEIYWALDDGKEFKLRAVEQLRNQIIKKLEDTGREYYRIWRDDDHKCFIYLNRDDLYPVKAT